MRRALTAALTCVLLLAGGSLPIAATAAEPPARDRALGVHLALGDSVAAGVGAPPGQGYVPLLSRELRDESGLRLGLVDLSVSGATTTTLIESQLPDAVDLLSSRSADRNERNDVRVVTITIGGNDVFGPVVAACVPTPGPACGSTVAERLQLVASNLSTILFQLRAAGGPEVTIVTTAYYNSLPACVLAPFAALGDVVLEGGSLPGLPALPGGLNDVTRSVTGSYGGLVADAYGRVGAADLVPDCLHPNASGHRIIASIFEAVLSPE